MRNKVIAALVAGGLLVGAGLVTSAISAPGAASAQEETDSAGEKKGLFHRGLEFLSSVLDDMVASGDLSREDADAVLAAVEAKATEIKAERKAIRDMIHGFLEDEVITEAEASQLPQDHWLLSDTFDEAWADGELTVAEIREAKPHPRRDAFRRGARLGALLDDGGIDQAEYDSLHKDNPLKQIDVSNYLSDGVITVEELREIRQAHRPDEDDSNA